MYSRWIEPVGAKLALIAAYDSSHSYHTHTHTHTYVYINGSKSWKAKIEDSYNTHTHT